LGRGAFHHGLQNIKRRDIRDASECDMISCSHWGMYPYTPTVEAATINPRWFEEYTFALWRNSKPRFTD
jgi:hypothetical protein